MVPLVQPARVDFALLVFERLLLLLPASGLATVVVSGSCVLHALGFPALQSVIFPALLWLAAL